MNAKKKVRSPLGDNPLRSMIRGDRPAVAAEAESTDDDSETAVLPATPPPSPPLITPPPAVATPATSAPAAVPVPTAAPAPPTAAAESAVPSRSLGPRRGKTTTTQTGMLRKTIYFSDEEWKAIRAHSYHNDMNYTDIVRAAIRHYLGLPPEPPDLID